MVVHEIFAYTLFTLNCNVNSQKKCMKIYDEVVSKLEDS